MTNEQTGTADGRVANPELGGVAVEQGAETEGLSWCVTTYTRLLHVCRDEVFTHCGRRVAEPADAPWFYLGFAKTCTVCLSAATASPETQDAA